jgi:hypothetical protein
MDRGSKVGTAGDTAGSAAHAVHNTDHNVAGNTGTELHSSTDCNNPDHIPGHVHWGCQA